jgi:hypothetical protein
MKRSREGILINSNGCKNKMKLNYEEEEEEKMKV